MLLSSISGRQYLLAIAVICCMLLRVGPAYAGPPSPPDEGPHSSRSQSKPPGREGPPIVRQEDAEGRRRAALMQESYAARAAGIDAAKRNSRMTPEERRDLRRQINEAGQDIYARPPGR